MSLLSRRCIVVLDRGWIFVGNLKEINGGDSYELTEAANIRKWQTGGFGGLSRGAKSSQAVIDVCEPIIFSGKAMIFAVPISESWDTQ
jgi:hypothetical protein